MLSAFFRKAATEHKVNHDLQTATGPLKVATSISHFALPGAVTWRTARPFASAILERCPLQPSHSKPPSARPSDPNKRSKLLYPSSVPPVGTATPKVVLNFSSHTPRSRRKSPPQPTTPSRARSQAYPVFAEVATKVWLEARHHNSANRSKGGTPPQATRKSER